ncbi:MAG: Kelch repeat-containing protein [Pirellulales bacterium]
MKIGFTITVSLILATLGLIPLQPLEAQLPNLPLTLTSFGGAKLGDDIYVYGGHIGGAHSYSTAEQSDHFLRLNAKNNQWEELPVGPKLQGLALVSDGIKIYRIGGFTAKNAEGEEHDLWSQSTVAQYDPSTNNWSDLPSLPGPRSSFDAAILDDTIYVLGGWSMAGEADNVWHKTGWKLDLSAKTLEWKSLGEIPFQRRALAVAAYQGKIYAIGGMQSSGEPTTRVDVYDSSTKEWSKGPSLVGEKGMVGFGASAFATGDHLYVSTINGTLQQLSKDGDAWKTVSKLANARFFHQMLPWKKNSLVMVGGASMQTGKFEEVDVIDVSN